MLAPRLLRPLSLPAGAHPRGQPHLSAASGIVVLGRHVYVVADDEHHLARIDAGDPASAPIGWVPLIAGGLPRDPAERKRRKPDLEVLLHLPATVTGGRDLLWLLGSGSRPQRERSFVVELDAHGANAGPAREVPSSALYAPLRARFPEVNIEAGCVDGGYLRLFQRANRGAANNARITYRVRDIGAWLRGDADAPPDPLAVQAFSLGAHEGVPFGITDAAAWPRLGSVFTAVAEDTQDAFRDGRCVASMVGWMDGTGQVRACELLAGAPKVEGIARVGGGRLWLVTDADDPARPSELLELAWQPGRSG